MIECKVDALHGKNIQSKISLRNCFEWSVRSVQTFTWDGKLRESTLTQVVYERPHDFPHRLELMPLEKKADKLRFPSVTTAVKSMIVNLVLTVLFGGIYGFLIYFLPTLMPTYPSWLTWLEPYMSFVEWGFLGLGGLFAFLSLIFIITAAARGITLATSNRKKEKILEEVARITAVPVAPSAPQAAPVQPMMQPMAQPMVQQPVYAAPIYAQSVYAQPNPVVQPQPVAQPMPAAPAAQPAGVKPLTRPLIIKPVNSAKPAAPKTPEEPHTEKPIE